MVGQDLGKQCLGDFVIACTGRSTDHAQIQFIDQLAIVGVLVDQLSQGIVAVGDGLGDHGSVDQGHDRAELKIADERSHSQALSRGGRPSVVRKPLGSFTPASGSCALAFQAAHRESAPPSRWRHEWRRTAPRPAAGARGRASSCGRRLHSTRVVATDSW